MGDRHDMGCFITCVADFLFLTCLLIGCSLTMSELDLSNKMEIVLVAFDVVVVNGIQLSHTDQTRYIIVGFLLINVPRIKNN